MLVAAAACSRDTSPTSPFQPVRVNPLLAPALVVTNTDDAGPGSLRQTLADATGGETIQFDPSIAGKTIVLSTGPLSIDKALTIEGPVTAGMTISGNLKSTVIVVTKTGDAILRNLSIVNGFGFTGGIAASGPLLLDHSLVANNQGILGGGINGSDAGALTLINTTVSGNSALQDGGGVYSSAPAITLRNSTISANSAARGGGLSTVGAMILRNTIVARNTATTVLNPNCYIAATSIRIFTGLNIADDLSCGESDALVVTDPGLGALDNNGGPTMTHALRWWSRSIDAGTQCSEPTDQRYVTRNQGVSCDIGAYEFTDFVDLTMTISTKAVVDPNTGALTVNGTMTCPGPIAVSVGVQASQPQKTAGRVQTIVQAAGTTTLTCTGPTSWSVTLIPQSGRFDKSSVSVTAQTFGTVGGVRPANATASVKVFTES
jgi:hypothetical protein